MPRKISTIKYNLHPDFPTATVERYPSLSTALGDSYPRLIAPVEEESPWNASSEPSEGSVPVACSTQPTGVGISSNDQTPPPEGMRASSSNNSFSSNSFFPGPGGQDRHLNLQAPSANTSVDPHNFTPVYHHFDGPLDITGDARSPFPLAGSGGGYAAPALQHNLSTFAAPLFFNDGGQLRCVGRHADKLQHFIGMASSEEMSVSPSPSIPISQPPGTWIFPEDGNFPTNKISEGSPDGSPNHHHRYRPAHATNFARSDHFVPFISNELVDEIREPTKIPSSPTSHSSATLHLLSNYYCGPEHTTFLSTPIEPRSPAIGFASGVPYLPSSYSIAEHREHGEPHLHRTDESDPEDLHSPSVCSASPRSDLHPTGAEADLTIHIEPHSIKLQKSYNCSTCHKSFARPSALRKHEKMHTTKQAFACDAVGCGKKFGVRSNLQRHQQVVHGIRRAHKWARDYKVEFEHPSLSPSLISDTASMPPSGLVWDNEGPFSRREINWPSSQTESSA